MSVESWIDNICKLWEIDNGRGGTVRSYRVYEKNEFPESITEYPCALTYTLGVQSAYSLAGPNLDMWHGVTEFHLFPGVDKRNFPAIMLFFARIRNAAASDIQLGGTVNYFLLDGERDPNIQGPVTLQYGSEEPHLGIIVYWVVKEAVTGMTVSA